MKHLKVNPPLYVLIQAGLGIQLKEPEEELTGSVSSDGVYRGNAAVEALLRMFPGGKI